MSIRANRLRQPQPTSGLSTRLRRPALTVAATCAATMMTCANALPGAINNAVDHVLHPMATAQAQQNPRQSHDPANDQEAGVWSNPQARSTDPHLGVRVGLASLDVQDRSIDAQLSLRNDTAAPVSNIALRVLSQPVAGSASAVRSAQLANFGEYQQSSELLRLPISVAPGESQTFSLHLTPNGSTAPESTNTLVTPGLFTEGSHPVMFSVTADAQSSDQSQGQQEPTQQLVGVARTTVSMTEPRTPVDPAAPAANPSDDAPTSPTPVTFMWPLAAETHVLGGATGEAPQRGPLYLTDEHLADELADNGRLRTLLDTYREALEGPEGTKLKQASCLAIDPELIDTVDRMARGYRVGTERPSPVDVPKQLRDSWGDIFGGDEPKYQEGRGAADARQWIADLKDTVNQGCSVALPYAGADLDTIAATQQDWLGVHAVAPGPQIVHRILGVWPTQNVVIPDAGYLTSAAAPLLRHADTLGEELDLSDEFERRVRLHNLADGAPAATRPGAEGDDDTVTAIVADNTLNVSANNPEADNSANTGITPVPVANITGAVPQSTRGQVTLNAVGYSADLGSALRATGSHPEIAAYSDPAKRYNVEEDSPAARMADATAIFDEEVRAGDAVVAIPPALWSVDQTGANAFLDAVTSSFADNRAEPAPLSAVMQQRSQPGNLTESYTDPGEVSAETVQRIADQANTLGELTTTMSNDPTIALTREAFTRPLYDDLTRATSSYRMRERSSWADVRAGLARRLDQVQDMIASLQRSVSLVPPGNVFTRTSDSSPLLVLARNGLPLPVPITLDYEVEDDKPLTLELPDDNQSIPAKGSITLSLNTSSESANAEESDANLTMWLNSQGGDRITEPVQLRMQSVPGVSPGLIIGVLMLLMGVGVAGRVLWNRRSGSATTSKNRRGRSHPQRLDLDNK